MAKAKTFRTRIRDPVVLAAACNRLGLAAPRLAKSLRRGRGARRIVLLGHPPVSVLIDVDTGIISFPKSMNRNMFAELCRLISAYARESLRIEAERHSRSIVEQKLEDGSVLIRLSRK
jgi:hypothetical protein